MSPEERRTYMGTKAEKAYPYSPLYMIASYGTGPGKEWARYALSEPMVEKYTLEELKQGSWLRRIETALV